MDEIWMMTPEPLLQHSRQQSAVEADGGEEVGIDGVLPIRVAQSQHAAARCGRTADIVNQDVHTTEAVQYFPGHLIHALACADIGLDKQAHCLPCRER